MKTQLSIDGTMILIGLAVVAVGYVSYKKDEIITAVNPADDGNFINTHVTDVVKKITMNESQSLGELTYKTRAYNPLAWIFEGVGRLTGDL